MKKPKKLRTGIIICIIAICITTLSSCNQSSQIINSSTEQTTKQAISQDVANSIEQQTTEQVTSISLSDIPAFNGSPYIAINNNKPFFDDSQITTTSFENYSELDSLGRCGVAFANICKEIMPTEERGEIGSVKPSGWHSIRYDIVDGGYLYNRCHLIGYQLAGENANEKNLITGTRYLNVEGMLPFENMVTDYVNETGNHVLYRVTPMYEGDNLVATGVLMEACSVEDNGEGIIYNVFCYNSQPGIAIDYPTGDSKEVNSNTTEDEIFTQSQEEQQTEVSKVATYILNTNTKKYHKPTCSSVNKIKQENYQEFTGDINELIQQGYEPCKNCN